MAYFQKFLQLLGAALLDMDLQVICNGAFLAVKHVAVPHLFGLVAQIIIIRQL